MNIAAFKGRVHDPGKRLFIFELNSQSNSTPRFCAPEINHVNWLELFIVPTKPLCLFTEPGLYTNTFFKCTD